jgi:(p)ppGpp synthase/HD superfamily hydrolase
METQQPYSRRRLQVVADADPGALARVVERLHNLNIIPRRVTAEFASNDILHIEVDVCGLPDEQLALIAGKIRQAPCVVNAYWYRLD